MLWDEILIRSRQEEVAAVLILREELQRAVLTHLSRRLFFGVGAFQGGTALRLLYGNPRFSEDLDFVFRTQDMAAFHRVPTFQAGLPEFVRDIFPFLDRVDLDRQKSVDISQRYALRCRAEILEGVLRLNLEFAAVPSRDNRLQILRWPPFDPVVRVETLREILADKVVAVALREYVKRRDLWDLHFLLRDCREPLDVALVLQKSMDYGADAGAFRLRLRHGLDRLRESGVQALEAEMVRFLPPGHLNSYREAFPDLVRAVADAVHSAMLETGTGRGETD